jgi:hypothetical protein
MKRPRDLADRSRDRSQLTDDGPVRVTFTLPPNAARLKARQILDQSPPMGYVNVAESWCQLPEGQVEFTMRRLPTAT